MDRVEAFCDRVIDAAESLEVTTKSRRVIDQIMGSGSSVGANLFEADEAMSPRDFCRSLGIAKKETNETRYWIRRMIRHNWCPLAQVDGLEQEANELKRIFGAMIAKTRKNLED